jgi:phage N-6-adenine-methyltransferase
MVGQTVMLSARELTESDAGELRELEVRIERGFGAFVDVGDALIKIRDARLYRDTHPTFEDYCRERWGMSRFYAHRLIAGAEATGNLLPIGNTPRTESQVRPLVGLEPEQQREAWQRAVETAPEGKVTAAHVERAVREVTGATVGLKTCDICGKSWAADLPFCPYCNLSPEERAVGLEQFQKVAAEKPRLDVHFSSESPEWYTPPEIIQRVEKLFGSIDLDPCSNSHKTPNVPAANRFTKDDDGLAQTWKGRVYMNPPYGREIVEWVEKLAAEYEAGNVKEAIALVPARTDTEWFKILREHPRCFIWGRLNFSQSENSAPFPSVVFYLGKRLASFIKAFRDLGDTYVLAS